MSNQLLINNFRLKYQAQETMHLDDGNIYGCLYESPRDAA